MNADINADMLLERLNTEDYVDRIDAIMDASSSDDEKIVLKLIEVAVSAMRGEVRVAAAVALCEHPTSRKIDLIKRSLSQSEGSVLSGGDPKATIALILAVLDGSYNLGLILEKYPDAKNEILEYLGKADRDYTEIDSGAGQIAYLLAWCAGIDRGYGDRGFIEYVGSKTRSSKEFVSSILEWM